MRNVAIISLIFLVLFFSCTDNRENVQCEVVRPEVVVKVSESIKTELKNAINDGDFKAYNTVSNYYILRSNWVEFYYYAQIMAHKYDCPEAHFHLYFFMTQEVSFDGIILGGKNKDSDRLSLYHLLRSYELGFKRSKITIDRVFKNKSIPQANNVLCG